MGPSESFPGREGTMVYANVLALIWTADESPTRQWALHYVTVPDNISICFRCVVDTLPQERRPILEKVWEAYGVEIAYKRAKAAEKGKWLSPGDATSFTLFDALEEKRKAVPHDRCIFCDKEVPDNENPYFTARVIDKVYSEQHLAQFFGQNYSWSDLKTGMIGFKICLACFRGKFPSSFRTLGYNLRRETQPSHGGSPKSELYLTS